jgi:hypothetical protein
MTHYDVSCPDLDVAARAPRVGDAADPAVALRLRVGAAELDRLGAEDDDDGRYDGSSMTRRRGGCDPRDVVVTRQHGIVTSVGKRRASRPQTPPPTPRSVEEERAARRDAVVATSL